MNYLQAVAYIDSLAPTILNPSLDRMAAFMDEAGRIQDTFSTIHVGGTNGKGSTVAILDSVLRAGGLKVGRCTGPHLLRWNERFHVAGVAIDDERFAELASRVRELSEDFGQRHSDFGCLTWFEFLTALFFYYMQDEKVDIAVVEVGLGGRWDATNVIEKPLASVITTIDLDHTHLLGDTVEAIAREKGGIIKTGVPLITGATGSALSRLQEIALARQAPVIACVPPHTVQGTRSFDVRSFQASLSQLALPGQYQTANALLAAAALDAIRSRGQLQHVDEEALRRGFAGVYWPGRFQYVKDQHLVFDGAHNPAGVRALRAALDQVFGSAGRTYVLSFFQNKNVPEMLQGLLRPQDTVYAAEAATTRATYAAVHIVSQAQGLGCQAHACPSIEAAFAQTRNSGGNDGLVVATGSFATVKECMLALGWQKVEDGRDVTAPPVLNRH